MKAIVSTKIRKKVGGAFAKPRLEHFHQSCSAVPGHLRSGLFGLGLRFGSVTGFFKPAPSPKPRPSPKILAAQRYIFSVNALKLKKGRMPLIQMPKDAEPLTAEKIKKITQL